MAVSPGSGSPPQAHPPPQLPQDSSISVVLSTYLNQFALWCRQGFAAKINANMALPGILLQANDAPANAIPATYQMAVDTAGELQTRPIALSSGDPGPWTTVGHKGVADGSNASVGMIGEHVSAAISGSLTNNVTTNLGGMSLSAGDWDVEGVLQVGFQGFVGQTVVVGVSTVAGSFPNPGQTGRVQMSLAANTINICTLSTGARRVNVSTITNVYLTGLATFSSGTCSVSGTLRVRRMR